MTDETSNIFCKGIREISDMVSGFKNGSDKGRYYDTCAVKLFEAIAESAAKTAKSINESIERRR